MKQQIESAFPQAKYCIESSDSDNFGVKEVEQKSYLVENPKDGILKITNPSKKMVYLLAVDQCVFSSAVKTRRCDCAVFNEKQLYFVEIKDCKSKNRDNHREDARDQLKATIELFRNKINFQSDQLKAVICFKARKIYPAFSVKQTDASIRFKQETGIILLEANEIKL
jgi:hypothetical protein